MIYKKGDTVSLLSMDRKETGKAKVKSVVKAKPNKFGIENYYITNKGTFSDMEVVGTRAYKLRFRGNTEKEVMKALNRGDRPGLKSLLSLVNFKEYKEKGWIPKLEDLVEVISESSADASLKKKAKKTGISFGILKQVFNRGKAAWRTGHRPGTNPTQWGHARVNSFATKSKGTWGGADKDLAAKARKSMKKESLWKNIHKKRERIKRGSGERMRKKGEKGAPTSDQLKRAKGESVCEALYDHVITEAEYQGKKVKLNDPIRSSDGKKKFHVYVKNEKGNVIKLGFGDPNMEIKRDDPKRRKSFRARHNCDNPGPKYKARYWSCYQWRGGSKVDN